MSAVVVSVVVVGALAWWIASGEERIARYGVTGVVNGIALDVDNADVEIVGSRARSGIRVQRTENVAFGRRPRVGREVADGMLEIRTRCPHAIPSTCSVAYRLIVPDNIPITVRTGSGDVSFQRYRGSADVMTRSGDVAAEEFCGFRLQARTDSGDIDTATTCSLERLVLRSRSGSVHATVPPGRYRVDVSSDGGTRNVSGLDAVDEAPFSIQALSSSGDVNVGAGR